MAQDLHQTAKRFGIKNIDTVKLEPGMVQKFFKHNTRRVRKRFRPMTPPTERRSPQRTTTSPARSDLTQTTATADDPINLCSNDEEEEDSNEEYITPPTSPLIIDLDEEYIEKKYAFYKFLYESVSESKTNQQLQAVGSSSATINTNPHKSSSTSHKTSSSSGMVSKSPYKASSSPLVASTSPYKVSRSSHIASTSLHKDSSSNKDSRSTYKDSKSSYKTSTRSHKDSSSSKLKGSREYVSQDQQLRWNKGDRLPRASETIGHKRHRSDSHSSRDIGHHKKSYAEKKVDYLAISDGEDLESMSDDVNNDDMDDEIDEIGDEIDEIDEIDDDDNLIDDSETDPFAVTSSKEIQSFFKHPVAQQSNNNSIIGKISEKKSTLYYKPIGQVLGVNISNGPSTNTHKDPSITPLCLKESKGGICLDSYCSYTHCRDFNTKS